MLTPEMKQTLVHHGRFTTLSLAATLHRRVMEEFMRLGVSPQTLAYFHMGQEALSLELVEGIKYVESQDEFNKIIKDLDIKEKP